MMLNFKHTVFVTLSALKIKQTVLCNFFLLNLAHHNSIEGFKYLYIVSFSPLSEKSAKAMKGVQKVIPSCLYLYSWTRYWNETKHKIQPGCALCFYISLFHLVSIVQYNATEAKNKIFQHVVAELFRHFLKPYPCSCWYFITYEMNSFECCWTAANNQKSDETNSRL